MTRHSLTHTMLQLKPRTGWKLLSFSLLFALLLLSLPGCVRITKTSGYYADVTQNNEIVVGTDNKDSVRRLLGSPTFISAFEPNIWYYVSRRTSQFAFLTPNIRKSNVMEIAFDKDNNVQKINLFDEKQIVRVNPSGDKTPVRGRKASFLSRIFRNIGSVGTGGGQ